jgi:hypothetical protein
MLAAKKKCMPKLTSVHHRKWKWQNRAVSLVHTASCRVEQLGPNTLSDGDKKQAQCEQTTASKMSKEHQLLLFVPKKETPTI